MCAMDTESDQAVDNDIRYGKRKRSAESVSDGEQPGRSQDPTHRDSEQSNSEQRPGKPSLKRPRPRRNTPGINVAEPNATSGDDSSPDLLQLPTEVFQHILSLLDPFSLARTMQLNRYTYRLLDTRQEMIRVSHSRTSLSQLTPDAIWSRSRTLHLPHLPYPLQSIGELDMLKLIFGKKCQRCGRLPGTPTLKLAETPWDSGPGPKGVRVIWPFRSRLCADCLRPLLLKETDLVRLGAQQLQQGLASVLFTPSLNYVMSVTLQQQPAPVGLQLTNYFFQPLVDELSTRASEVHALGESMYVSWLNGLHALSQQTVTDAIRWETWEVSQKGSHELHNTVGRTSASESGIHSELYAKSNRSSSSGAQRPRAALSDINGTSSFKSGGLFPRPSSSLRSSLLRADRQHLQPGSNAVVLQPLSTTMTGSGERFLPRSNPPSFDITRLRNDKRADIERRCLQLNPLIHLSSLDQSTAFRAAMQVLMPLDDKSWEVLKARLVHELEIEDNFSTRQPNAPSLAGSTDNWTALRAATPPDEPVEDDPRNQALRPTRDKLRDFAGEYVRRRYAHGTNLTHSSAPQFAADVLLYARRRFYETQAREDDAFVANGQTPPDDDPRGTRTRKLKLEHMRYVFETSVKPYTEFVRKDLFLCSACDTQGKHFLFEAIIQHFASKHTDSFSRGTAVVYWKAEWPPEPPFHPTPSKDVEWSPDAPHRLPTHHLPFSVGSSETSRLASTTTLSDDHRTAWSDTLSHDPPGFQQVRDAEGELSRRSNWVEPTHDYHVMDRSTPRARSVVHDSLRDTRVIDYDQARYSTMPSTEFLNSQPNTEIERQQRHLYPSSVEHYGFVESHQHPTTLANESPFSRAVERNHDRYRVFAEPVLGQTRISDSSGTARSGEAEVVYDRGHYARSRNPTHMNVSYGTPEAVRSTYVLGNYPRESLQNYEANFSEPRPRPEAAERYEHVSAPDNESKPNAAQRFLDSLNPEMVDPHDKNLERYPTDWRNPLPAMPDPLHPREVMIDRRPNISQPRRRGRNTATDEDMFYVPTSSIVDERMYEGQRQSRDRYVERDSYLYGQRETDALPPDSAYRREFQPPMQAINYADIHSDRELIPLGQSARGDPHRSQRYRYVDSYGREFEPVTSEMANPHTRTYRQVRYETLRHPEDSQIVERPHGTRQYEQEEGSWGPEAEARHLEGPLREYPMESRYVHYEQLPDTPVVHGEGVPRYIQSTRARPPYEDPRSQRRQ